ncbi:MAG: GntR family transcriptional regulator [Planctomycetes bacterium]|nr:GntR family transcriptional regulator [Planctomycetota bacterium]
MSVSNRLAETPAVRPAKKRGLLKEQAYFDLKRLILSEAFEPGAFLSERQLAARLKMSKTPIKAALERLETEGFIGVSPQQGIVVQDLTLDEIADHFEVREALETYVVRRLSGKLTAEQTARMRANLDAQLATVEQLDVPANGQLDAEFHLLWCDFFGNRAIVEVMQQLRDRIHRIIARVNSRNPARLRESYEEHVRIAEAVIAGDGDLAARSIEEHLSYGKSCLLARRRP